MGLWQPAQFSPGFPCWFPLYHPWPKTVLYVLGLMMVFVLRGRWLTSLAQSHSPLPWTLRWEWLPPGLCCCPARLPQHTPLNGCECVVTGSYLTQPIHGLEPTRLLCSWDFPSKNTGVGSCFLLQGIPLTWGSHPCLFCLLHLQRWQADSSPPCYLGSPSNPGTHPNGRWVCHTSLDTDFSSWSVFANPDAVLSECPLFSLPPLLAVGPLFEPASFIRLFFDLNLFPGFCLASLPFLLFQTKAHKKVWHQNMRGEKDKCSGKFVKPEAVEPNRCGIEGEIMEKQVISIHQEKSIGKNIQNNTYSFKLLYI